MSGLEGTTLGRYHLLDHLGAGGMGEVYLAHDELMNRDVAIKVVSGNHTDFLERFRREAEAIGNLNHDHILPAYDYGVQDPWHYLVMPYITHRTLYERLLEGPLSLEEAGEMLDQIASALQFAHDNGILHRDIKPSNILLRDDHYAYLADFGLAKAMEGGHTVTQTGILLGTPEYMAPDLAEGPATPGSDIYALGILLYEMITGQVPFIAETPMAVYWKQIRDEPAPPSQLNPAIPPAIDQVILQALDKDPAWRFQTAQELADAYREALASLSSEALASYDASSLLYNTSVQDQLEPLQVPAMASSWPIEPDEQEYIHPIPVSPQPLILPGDPLIEPRAIAAKELYDTPSVALSLPESSSEQLGSYDPVTPFLSSPYKKVRRHRGAREGNTRATRIIVTGLLITIALPMSILYMIYVLHQAPTSASPHGQANRAAVSQAKVQAAATQLAQAQATATGAATVIETNGTPLFSDSLAQNVNGRWAEDPINCRFLQGSYHVIVKQANFLQPCQLSLPVDNAIVQVDATLLSGNDIGMLIRLKGEQFYDFEINNQGQFFFRRHDVGEGADYHNLISPTLSSAIAPTGQKNTLLVSANGSDFKLYINQTFVGEVRDTTYADGEVALATGTLDPITTGEGSFANFKLYKAH